VSAIGVGVPAAPVLWGSVQVAGAMQVEVKGRHAFVAAYSGSNYPSIDFSLPANPVVNSTPQDFVPSDVTIAGEHAFYAEQLFVSAIPIVSIRDPDNPLYQTVIDLSRYGDRDCKGIDADSQFVLCASGNRLYINQYRQQVDLAGLAPLVSIEAPAQGEVLYQGRPYRVQVNAEDDVRVAAVNLYANDVLVHADVTAPYSFVYRIPEGAEGIRFRAEALDLGSNVGVAEHTFTTQPLTALDEAWTDVVIDYFDEDLLARSISMNRASYTSAYGLSSAGNLEVGGTGASSIVVDSLNIDGDLIVDGVTLTLQTSKPVNVLGNVILRNGARLVTGPANSVEKIIHSLVIKVAGQITVSQDSAIDVSGLGYPANRLSWADFTFNDHWGCHGGMRSHTQNRVCGYGRLERARFAGSSGVSMSGAPASGGGVIDITAAEIVLYGMIRANGQNGHTSYGGGAGGAVHIAADSISGMGSIEARGGRGGSHSGGGGRISLHVEDMSAHTGSVRADGYSGGAGTIYLKRATDTFGELIIDNFGAQAAAYSTSVRQVGEHPITNVVPFSPGIWYISIGNSAWEATDLALDRGVQGEWVSLNAADPNARRYRIEENGTDYLVVQTNDNLFESLGNSLVGVHVFDRLSLVNGAWLDVGEDRLQVLEASNSRIGDGGTVSVAKPSQSIVDLALSEGGGLVSSTPLEIFALDVAGDSVSRITAPSLTVQTTAKISGQHLVLDLDQGLHVGEDLILASGAVMTVPGVKNAQMTPLKLVVGDLLSIDADSNINLNGKGWRDRGPHSGDSCHGGAIAVVTGCEYGRYKRATFAGQGSGGAFVDTLGGGYGHIEAGRIMLDGGILASGVFNGSRGNGGAGGGLDIQADQLSGSGLIRANGSLGSTGYYKGHAAGGGRISLSIGGHDAFSGHVQAASPGGGAGTVFWQAPQESYGHLVVDNEGTSAPHGSTRIEHVGRHVITDAVDQGNGRWRVSVGSTAWQATNEVLERGIQGLEVSLDAADPAAPLYTVVENSVDWFEIETVDDLSGYVGNELVGVHTFETLQVKDGASVDFRGDRLIVLDSGGSDMSGEILNVD